MNQKKESSFLTPESSESEKTVLAGTRAGSERALPYGSIGEMPICDGLMVAFSALPAIIDSLPEKERSRHRLTFDKLRERFFHDPEFKLAVIGNFSCGKSTFLNALIGRELLTTGDLPTTAIPTYIRWNREEVLMREKLTDSLPEGRDPIIVLTTRNADRYVLTESGRDLLAKAYAINLPKEPGNMIDYLTTNNFLAPIIARLEISFPEKEGMEHLCLIDTPGLNPGDEESRNHIIEAQNVLREQADAAIVLYTALNAMSRDTKQFMEENAAHLMDNAIILLTKMDLVPVAQVEKLIRYTVRLVRTQFGQNDPAVYSISARSTLEYYSGRSKDEQDHRWAEAFEEVMQTVIGQLQSRRVEIISRRTADLMEELIDTISLSVANEAEMLKTEQSRLESASAARLEKDFERIKDSYFEQLERARIDQHASAVKLAKRRMEETCKTELERLDRAKTWGELNRCLKEHIPEEMEKTRLEILQELRESVIPKLNSTDETFQTQVTECLERYHRNLGALSAKIISADKGPDADAELTVASAASKSVFGSHAGFLLASSVAMFIPGFNVLVLAAGWMVDRYRFAAKKEEARKSVEGAFLKNTRTLIFACQDSVNQATRENKKWAENLLASYRRAYKEDFERVEQAYRQHAAEVQYRIIQNRVQMKTISELKALFTSARISE